MQLSLLLARLFRGVHVVRAARARRARRVAARVGLASAAELAELTARLERALGRAERMRGER